MFKPLTVFMLCPCRFDEALAGAAATAAALGAAGGRGTERLPRSVLAQGVCACANVCKTERNDSRENEILGQIGIPPQTAATAQFSGMESVAH